MYDATRPPSAEATIVVGEIVRPGGGFRPGTRDLALAGFLARYTGTTRIDHHRTLRKFFRWCDDYKLDVLGGVTRPHIELYLRELEEIDGNKASTVSHKLSTLHVFYVFASADGHVDVVPTLMVRRPTVPRRSTTNALSRPELADLLRTAEQSTAGEFALVCLLALNGLRVSEACAIQIEDFTTHRGRPTITIHRRKGGQVAEQPLYPLTMMAVQAAMGDRTTGPLLLTSYGTPMMRNAARFVCKRLAVKAGITKRFHPHCLRHTFVTLSRDAGSPDRDIQNATGHQNATMIGYYDANTSPIIHNSVHRMGAFVEGAW